MNKALYNLIRTHYRNLQGYVSAGMEVVKNADRVFMNANENPYELPGLEGFNRYPEPQSKELLQAYANVYGVSPDNIVMTRGADEAIVILTRLFCEPKQSQVLICSPTFGMYAVDAKAIPAQIIDVPLIKQSGTFELAGDEIIRLVMQTKSNAGVRLIFLCSPNNPTGTSFDQQEIKRICQQTEQQAVVILDETYIEFSELDGMTRYLDELPNLIILRTLSKSYSMAGMRMGSLLSGDTDFIQLIRTKCLDAYPLPQASIEAGLKALSADLREIVRTNIATLVSERKRLQAAIEPLSFIQHIYPSDANFLLIEVECASELISYCKSNNLILRDFSAKPGTENCIRISVGLPEQNDYLVRLSTQFSQKM